MKLDLTKPCVLSATGNEARFLACITQNDEKCFLFAVLLMTVGKTEGVYTYRESQVDMYVHNKKTKITKWLNIFNIRCSALIGTTVAPTGPWPGHNLFDDMESAVHAGRSYPIEGYIRTVKVEWEE